MVGRNGKEPGRHRFTQSNEVYMIPESQIGKNIKALRLSQKQTLESLAAKAGITKGYLSKVENSDKAPPISTLIVIA